MAVLRKKEKKSGFVWVVDYTYKGKRRITSTETSDYKLAKKILGQVQGKIAEDKFELIAPKKKEINLKQFFHEYLESVKGLKAETTLNLEKTYTERFLNIIKDQPLRSIDFNTVNKWKGQFSRGVGPTTVNIVIRTLRGIFNRAIKMGYIDKNPFDDIEKIKVQEKRLFFTSGELTKLFTEIDKDIIQPSLSEKVINFRKRFKLYVEFLLRTGLRRGEALRLRKENIDYDQNVIYIEKTKTTQMRSVPLTKRARAILLDLGTDLFSKLNEHDVTNKFRYYLDKSGIKGFKLHSLRHTYACQLMASGVDIFTISRLLGHTDIKTTMIYAKINSKTLKSAVEKLDSNYLYLEGGSVSNK
jgi:integrase